MALALCADLRIAAQSAAFHRARARAGTSPDGGLSWTLPTPSLVTRPPFGFYGIRGWFLRKLRPAAWWGRWLPMTPFRTLSLARQRNWLPSLPGCASDQALGGAGNPGAEVHSHLRDELSYVRRGLGSEDGKEAVRAIFEKRTPTFRGR